MDLGLSRDLGPLQGCEDPLFDNFIGRKRSVGDEVLAGTGIEVLVLGKTLADYVFRAILLPV
jgi:hypothetical protein